MEDQQGTRLDHMEAGVLGHMEVGVPGHTADGAGIHPYVSFELFVCILLAVLVAVSHYSTLRRRREEEMVNICRHIPEHSNGLLAVVPLPHILI